jgi:hypothetical protein
VCNEIEICNRLSYEETKIAGGTPIEQGKKNKTKKKQRDIFIENRDPMYHISNVQTLQTGALTGPP